MTVSQVILQCSETTPKNRDALTSSLEAGAIKRVPAPRQWTITLNI